MTSTKSQDNNHRKTVREWLKKNYKWRIPVYQRHYAWNPEEPHGPTQLFWEIVQAQAAKRLAGEVLPPHYFGAVLVDRVHESLQDSQSYDVVDGQQRLTTLNLAMFALIGAAKDHQLIDEMRDQLAEYICTDEHRQEPKLQPTNFDREQYEQLLFAAYRAYIPPAPGENPQYEKSKVVMAFGFLYKRFTHFIDEFIKEKDTHTAQSAIEALKDSILDGFELVLIPLEETDEAQKIFESMNNTARPLSTFDLIRNNVFYRAAKEKTGLDIELFRGKEWRQLEEPYWEEQSGRRDPKKLNHIETYISRMLIAKRQRLIYFSTHEIFKEYKEFSETIASPDKRSDVRKEIVSISEYTSIYKHLVSGERNPTSGVNYGLFLHSHSENLVFYPILFIISTCEEPDEEKQRMVNLLESYVIRRSICDLTASGYNQETPRICKEISINSSNGKLYENLSKFLKKYDGNSNIFPDDKTVRSGCINENFYKLKFKQYVFSRIAQHLTSATMNETRDIGHLTIDHIIPRGWRENSGWNESLMKRGDYDEHMIDSKINTIGNLTPMAKGLNSGKSNHAWRFPKESIKNKKSARDWLRESDLSITREIGENNDTWDISNVISRSEKLAEKICEIWPDIE